MAYTIDKRLTELFVRELPVNRRQQLCSYLNTEQVLMSDCGLARDYRGIAQQLDLTYSDIAQLEKLCDPCGSLLNDQRAARLSVYDLFELLAFIGRYDILDDMIPVILEEISLLKERKQSPKNEIILPPRPPETDLESTIWYDAYVCYADQDIDFARHLTEYLESPEIGFRLFLRDRDLLGGNWIYETFARLIETQCRRMIIVLSPDFFESAECKFQSLFATGLAIEKCSRILIPIIHRPCLEIPSLLRQMSKIDMRKDKYGTIPQWSMKRLIMSIRGPQSTDIKPQLNQIDYPYNSRNDNSFPGPSNHPLMIAKDEPNRNTESHPKIWTATEISVISSDGGDDESAQLIKNPIISTSSQSTANQDLSNQGPSSSSTSSGPKNWLKSIKRKIKVPL